MDILFWLVGVVLTGWGLYDLYDWYQERRPRVLRNAVISLVLGGLNLIGLWLM